MKSVSFYWTLKPAAYPIRMPIGNFEECLKNSEAIPSFSSEKWVTELLWSEKSDYFRILQQMALPKNAVLQEVKDEYLEVIVK